MSNRKGKTTTLVQHQLITLTTISLNTDFLSPTLLYQLLKTHLLLFMEDISTHMKQQLHIDSQRQPPMKIPKELLQQSKARWNEALLGHVYTEDELNNDEVLSALRLKWKFGRKLEVLFHPKNRFVLRCEKQSDRARLLREQPWSILGHLLFFQVFDQASDPGEVSFTVSPMWLSFSGLLIEHELPKIIQIIASAAGEVEEIYPNDSSQRPTGGFRAKVRVHLDQPLVQGGYADTIDQGYKWISFHYLGLPYFYCTNCFGLGHIDSTCATATNRPTETQDLITAVGGDSEESVQQNTSQQQNDVLTLKNKGNMQCTKSSDKGKTKQPDDLMNEDISWINSNPLTQIFGPQASNIMGTTSYHNNILTLQPISQTNITTKIPKSIRIPSSAIRGRPPRYGPRRELLVTSSLSNQKKNLETNPPTTTSTSAISTLSITDTKKPFKKQKLTGSVSDPSLTEEIIGVYHPIPPHPIVEDRSMLIQNTARSTYSMDLISKIIANPEVQTILMAQGFAINPTCGDCKWNRNYKTQDMEDMNQVVSEQPIREDMNQVVSEQPIRDEAMTSCVSHNLITVEDYGISDSRVQTSSYMARSATYPGFNPYLIPGSSNTPSTQEVYDKNTFTFDDRMGDVEIDIRPFMQAVKMGLSDLPNSTIITKVMPSTENFLSKESLIKWFNGKVVQDMCIRLQNVESGQVELELQWIELPCLERAQG